MSQEELKTQTRVKKSLHTWKPLLQPVLKFYIHDWQPPNYLKNICKNRKGFSPCLNGVLIIQSWDWGGNKDKDFTSRCVRHTYPIQEAVDPKDHFPLEHQKAEGEREIETKQFLLGHPFAALLSQCLSFLRHLPHQDDGWTHPRKIRKKIYKEI